MKLLLTSTGLSNSSLQTTFLDLIRNFKIEEIKVALIPTAANTVEEKEKINSNIAQLEDLRIKNKNMGLVKLKRYNISQWHHLSV